MPNRLNYQQFTLILDATNTTNITLVTGDYPVKPYLVIVDKHGQQTIPFESCLNYLDSHRHLSAASPLHQAFEQACNAYTNYHLALTNTQSSKSTPYHSPTSLLTYNAAVGIQLQIGPMEELTAFLAQMKPYHIHSFWGGTVHLSKLDKPLLVFRTGTPGRYWSTSLPDSPWQQGLDLAMHPSLYGQAIFDPSWEHPANKGVLMYEIPAGQVIAYNQTAPQFGWPGQKMQVFLLTFETAHIKSFSWDNYQQTITTDFLNQSNWQPYFPYSSLEESLLAKRADLYDADVAGIRFFIENAQTSIPLQTAVARIAKIKSPTVQTITQLLKTGVEQGRIRLNAFNIHQVADNAKALTYFYPDGMREVLLQTHDHQGLLLELVHEWSHAVLPLAMPVLPKNGIEQHYAANMRYALLSDYWAYNQKRHTLVPIQKRVANWLFHQPQTYLKPEWLAERLAFGVQAMAESEAAMVSIAPRFSAVVKQYVTDCSMLPPALPASTLGHKQLAHTSFLKITRHHPVATLPLETTTITWRPMFSDARRLPWYQRPNYAAIGQKVGKLVMPTLIALDIYNRVQCDYQAHPASSALTHASAITTGLALDYGSFITLAKFTSTSTAAAILIPLDLMSDIAHLSRDVEPATRRNDRDLLISLIDCYDLGHETRSRLLVDFDNGGKQSRDFIENAITVSKLSLKPFVWLHDLKEGITNLPHTVADWLWPENQPLIKPADPQPSYQETGLSTPALENLANQFDDLLERGQGLVLSCQHDSESALPLPVPSSQTSPLAQLQWQTPNLMLTHYNANQLWFELKPATVADTQLPALLASLNDLSPGELEQLQKEFAIENLHSLPQPAANKEQPATPFIKQFELGMVAPGKIGGIATLSNGAQISLGAGAGGAVFVGIKIPLDAAFLMALGQTLAIGAAIAVVVFSTSYLYQSHFNNIQKRLHSGIKHTDKERKILCGALARLDNHINYPKDRSVAELIKETNNVIHQFKNKAQKEQEQSQKDYKESKTWRTDKVLGGGKKRCKAARKASDVHADVANNYQDIIADLRKNKAILLHEDVQQTFIDSHDKKTAAELMTLTQQLTNKKQFTADDVASIDGVRHLIINKVIELTGLGKLDEAQQLLATLAPLTYFKPGNITPFTLKASPHKTRSKTNDDIGRINRYVARINQQIASGQDPTRTIQDLKNLIYKGNTKEKSLFSRWQARKHGTARCAQLTAFINDSINPIKQQYANGKMTYTLNLTPLLEVANNLLINHEQPANFWLSKLSDTTSNNGTTENGQVIKAFYSFQLINHVIKLAGQGDIQNAVELLGDMAHNLPAFQASAGLYRAKLTQLTPLLTANAHFLFNHWQTLQNNAPLDDTATNADTAASVNAYHFECAVVTQLILKTTFGELLNHGAHAQWQAAQTLLIELKTAMPEHTTVVTGLLSLIDALRLHGNEMNYCLALLKNGSAINTIARELELIAARYTLTNELFQQTTAGNWEQVNTLMMAYLAVDPDQEATITDYLAGVDVLKTLKGQTNSELLATMRLNQAITERTSKDDIVSATLHQWIIENSFNLAAQGQLAAARYDLDVLRTMNSHYGPLITKLIAMIDYAEQNSHQGEAFWLNCYQDNVAKLSQTNLENSDEDPHVSVVANLGKTLSDNALLKLANQRGQLGFNREAAAQLRRFMAMNSALRLDDLVDDFDFAHQGQVLQLFAKPLQAALTRYVRSWQPSMAKTAMLVGLEGMETAQLIAPNGLSLSAQALHAHCITGNTCTLNRNVDKVWQQLSKDINPFDPDFNPFNPETYANGALVYSQVLLKAIQYVPLQWLVPHHQLLAAEEWRANTLWYGQLACRSAVTLTVGMQLQTSLAMGLAAATPFQAVTLAQAAIDLGYWGYQRYKTSRGEAVEDLNHYLTQENLGVGLDSIGSIAFAGLITGGFGLIAGGVAVVACASGAYRVMSEAAYHEAGGKVLSAALTNIDFYRDLKTRLHYLDHAKYQLISRAPNADELKLVQNGTVIWLTKEQNRYYLYYLDNQKVYKKNITELALIQPLCWPTTDNTQALTVASQIPVNLLEPLKKWVKSQLINAPLVSNYTTRCSYRITTIQINEANKQAVNNGQEIIIHKQVAANNLTHYGLHFKTNKGQLDHYTVSYPIMNQANLSAKEQLIAPDHQHYLSVSTYATHHLIDYYLVASEKTLENTLTKVFNGLAYHANQLPIANHARTIHLFHRVKQAFDKQDDSTVLQLSEKICLTEPVSAVVINNDYRLLPHLAWQIIVYFRLAAYAQSPDLLPDFTKQFQEYAQYLSDSALTDKTWYDNYWPEVQKSLESILSFVFRQFITSAQKAENNEQKRAYLAYIPQHYKFCRPWHQLLDSDECLFTAAYIYHTLGDYEKCKLFFNHINNLATLIKHKKETNFTEVTLAILEHIDINQYQQILLTKEQTAFALNDDIIVNKIIDLLNKKKFKLADKILQQSHDFQGKATATAHVYFKCSNQTALLTTLQALTKETKQTQHYWILLYEVMQKCLILAKYCPYQTQRLHAMAFIYGMLKISADHLQTSADLPFEIKKQVSETSQQALDYLRIYVKFQHYPNLLSEQELEQEVDVHIQQGHQALRGENNISLLSQFTDLCTHLSYKYLEPDSDNTALINVNYLPIDVPADGDCAFHVLGISREKAIRLLRDAVGTQKWMLQTSLINSHDIVNLLLDDLAIANNTHYDRCQACFNDNKITVLNYLDNLEKKGTWMAHNQAAISVLDILAFLLQKNLRIFIGNEKGRLTMSNTTILHQKTFTSVDMLYTSANGFTTKLGDYNHYIKLVKMESTINEVADDYLENRQTTPANLVVKKRVMPAKSVRFFAQQPTVSTEETNNHIPRC